MFFHSALLNFERCSLERHPTALNGPNFFREKNRFRRDKLAALLRDHDVVDRRADSTSGKIAIRFAGAAAAPSQILQPVSPKREAIKVNQS